VLLPGRAARVKDPPYSDAVAAADDIAGAVCSAVTRRNHAPWWGLYKLQSSSPIACKFGTVLPIT
jgi:hypothetical protein